MVQRIKALLEKLKWSHVFLVIGAGAAAFYFMQDNSDIDQHEQGIQSEQANIASIERKIQEAKEFERQFEEKKKRYADLVKQLQSLKEALPRQFYLPDLLSDLLREAKQLEIEILRVTPDAKEEQGELYNTLGFQLESKGTFVQFFIFLDRMAHMQRLINVDNFAIAKDGSHPSVVLGGTDGAFADSKLSGGRQVYVGITANMRLLTYRYRGNAGAAPPPSPAPGGKK